MLKFALLALLAQADRHGYELKAAFERLVGGTWPLNIGQVYTLLARLEEDGLVASHVVPQEKVPDRKVYSLTETGHKELSEWMEESVPAPVRMRDEIFLRLVLQQAAGLGDPTPVIERQRRDHLTAIAQLSQLRSRADTEETTGLLLDGLILRLEADLKWLDLCEERARRTER